MKVKPPTASLLHCHVPNLLELRGCVLGRAGQAPHPWLQRQHVLGLLTVVPAARYRRLRWECLQPLHLTEALFSDLRSLGLFLGLPLPLGLFLGLAPSRPCRRRLNLSCSGQEEGGKGGADGGGQEEGGTGY